MARTVVEEGVRVGEENVAAVGEGGGEWVLLAEPQQQWKEWKNVRRKVQFAAEWLGP